MLGYSIVECPGSMVRTFYKEFFKRKLELRDIYRTSKSVIIVNRERLSNIEVHYEKTLLKFVKGDILGL